MMKKRGSYNLAFKLNVVKYAEESSISLAAEHFKVNQTQVKRWKKDKQIIQSISDKNRKAVLRNRQCKWPLLEEHLKTWIIDQHIKGNLVSGTSILEEARKQAGLMNITDFKGSPNWVFKFMKRNQIVEKTNTPVEQHLPDNWKTLKKDFIDFIIKHKVNYSLEQIGSMDEVSVTFDLPPKFTIVQNEASDTAIKTSSSEKCRFTIVLCVTADGTKLPAYVIFRRLTIPTGNYPNNIIVSANEKACMNSTETLIWFNKVWSTRKTSSPNEKSLLMLDSAPGHCSDVIKEKFKSNETLMAIIPDGITKSIQVLDIEIKDLFKSLLHSKWEKWMLEGIKDFTESANLKQATYEDICNWISEAWNEIPQSLIINAFKKTSFGFYNKRQLNKIKYLPNTNETVYVDKNQFLKEQLFKILSSNNQFDSGDDKDEEDESMGEDDTNMDEDIESDTNMEEEGGDERDESMEEENHNLTLIDKEVNIIGDNIDSNIDEDDGDEDE